MKLPDHLKTFLAGSAIAFVGNIAFGIINYLVRRTMAINLSVSDYGGFYACLSLIAIILAFLDLGIVKAGTLLIAEAREQTQKFFFSILILKATLGVFCALVFWLFRDIIAHKYLNERSVTLVGIFALYIIIQSIDSSFTSYYLGRKKYKIESLFNVAKAALLLLLVYILTRSYAIDGAASAFGLALICFFPLQFIWLWRHEKFQRSKVFCFSALGQLLSLVGSVAIITLMQNILFNMDTVMLTILRGTDSAGIYNVALPTTQIILTILVFGSVFMPLAVEMVQAQKFDILKKYVLWALAVTTVLLPAVFLVALFGGNLLITILFTRSYASEAAPLLPYLMTGYTLFTFASFLTQILMAMRHFKAMLILAFIVVAFNFIANYILISLYAATGAALATALSYGILALGLLFIFFIACSKRVTVKQ